jgi:hypothetical protein
VCSSDLLQRAKILKEQSAKAALQLELDLADLAEKRQRQADRRYWQQRLEGLEKELAEEPKRIASSYQIRAERLEPVGLIYLWPQRA